MTSARPPATALLGARPGGFALPSYTITGNTTRCCPAEGIKVNTVAVVEPRFGSAFNWSHIVQDCRVREGACGRRLSNGIRIFQRPEPIPEGVCLADFEHAS